MEGVSDHILKALDRAAGFIAVMHHRGEVRTPHGSHIRASVWVEQEIAIAAFLVQAQEHALPAVTYVQDGIRLEGLREKIILNPVTFKDDREVTDDIRRKVTKGSFFRTAKSVARS